MHKYLIFYTYTCWHIYLSLSPWMNSKPAITMSEVTFGKFLHNLSCIMWSDNESVCFFEVTSRIYWVLLLNSSLHTIWLRSNMSGLTRHNFQRLTCTSECWLLGIAIKVFLTSQIKQALYGEKEYSLKSPFKMIQYTKSTHPPNL